MAEQHDGNDTAFLPSDKSAAPAVGTLPQHLPPLRNLAGDEELCDKVAQWAYQRVTVYDAQEARTKYMKTGGTMDIADRMLRMSLHRNTANDQNEDTRSNVVSSSYFNAIRAITAGENLVYFNGRDLPARYEPEVDTDEYSVDQGKLIADQQNMLEQFTFDEDKRIAKIKDITWANNKYANCMVSDQWQRIVERRMERVPKRDAEGKVKLNDNGTVNAFEFKEVERPSVDWPVLQMHDLKDCFFDCQIDDMNAQNLYAIREKQRYDVLRSEQESGQILNVEKLDTSALYQGDSTMSNSVLQDRMTNAGEGATLNADGTIQIWHVWGMFPIKENTGKKPKGKWNPGGTPTTRYWATFAGDLGSKPVCLRLVKNPNFNGRVPHKLLHSHRDDKGALHGGFPTMLENLYEQATVNRNQAFDNTTLINQAPWVVDGPVLTRNLASRANKLITIGRGVQFKQQDVRDATQATSAMADRVEADIERTAGADKPIVGEALGARTSATEAKQVLDQALVPLDDKASYFADQLFPWLLEMDAALWRQYGDPKTVRRITRGDDVLDLMPAELWGPIRTKVTAIDRFKTNVQRRQDFNSFFQNVFPQAKEYMGPAGGTQFMRDAFHEFGFENANEYFPVDVAYDARQQALRGAAQMFMQGVFVEPAPQENHQAWLSVLRPLVEEYSLLPDSNPEILNLVRQHIVRREQMQADQKEARMADMQQQEPQQIGPDGGGEEPRGLPGEIAGNPIEAMEGAMANG